MLSYKSSLLAIVVLSIITFNANATPVFARQYDVHCENCHTKAPALNSTGKTFLRLGFRFSEDEASMLELLLAKESKDRKIPLGLMVGVGYSTAKDEVSVGAKIFLTGSITKNLSFFGVTKEGLVNSDNDSMKFFKEESSRAYFQYNIGSASNVIIAGLFAPLSQYGNVQRASAGSGLQDLKPDDLPGYFKYKTPLQESKVERVKGLQYSYLAGNNIQYSLAYGEQVSGSDGNEDRFSSAGQINSEMNGPGSGPGGGGGPGNGPGEGPGEGPGNGPGNGEGGFGPDQDDSNSLIVSIRFGLPAGYQLGLIYNNFDESGQDAYSLLLPLEKTFNKFSLNSTLVYKDSDAKGEYYGLENAVIVTLGMMTYVKAIANFANDENDDFEQGYHLSYNRMFNRHFMASISAIYADTEYQSTDSLNASFHLVY